MSCKVPKSFVLTFAVLSLVLPALADDPPATDYNETGTVLSTVDKHGHYYQVATDSLIFLFLCTKVKGFQFGSPECKIGDKPIAKNDVVHFRIEGDWAYMPLASPSTEEKLRIMATELKVTPPLPHAPPASSDKKSKATPEPGVIIGTGMQVRGQHGGSWSTVPAAPANSSMPSGPVVAIPVTGGAPVVVTPVSPAAGGVVTGIPVSGGPPIVGVPVSGTPTGGAAPGGGVVLGGGAPQWEHIMRVQTATDIYEMECSAKPCKIAGKEVSLGDTVAFRADKKWAYIDEQPSVGFPVPEPERYRTLSVTSVVALASAPKPQ